MSFNGTTTSGATSTLTLSKLFEAAEAFKRAIDTYPAPPTRKILVSSLVPEEHRQIRFPKSKKKRIRKSGANGLLTLRRTSRQS